MDIEQQRRADTIAKIRIRTLHQIKWINAYIKKNSFFTTDFFTKIVKVVVIAKYISIQTYYFLFQSRYKL